MSNYSAFDKTFLKLLIEPFAPGMTGHITPIKYEAITPDLFLFIFRTTSPDGQDHFFVSLETDHIDGLVGARCDIEEWHGTDVIDFWPRSDKRSEQPSENIEDYKTPSSGAYFAMLAEVKRPTHKGYWAEALVIRPGDHIGEKIKDYPEDVQANIRSALSNVLQHSVDPTMSFLESLNAKKLGTMGDDINQTNMAVSIYVQPNGSVEMFYNNQPPKQ